MSKLSDDRTELEGWKAIAGYLGVSIRTAQNFEKDYGLPVRRGLGIKAPVYALDSEIDEWVENRRPAPGVSPVPIPEQSSTRSTDEPSRSSIPRKSWIVAFGGLVVALLAAAVIYAALRPKGPPVALAVLNQHLIARNASGQDLWRFQFPSPPSPDFYVPWYFEHRTWIGDLANSGEVSVLSLFMPADFTQKPHRLFCLSASGKLLWEFVPGRTITDARGLVMAPPYYVRQICVLKGRKPEDTRIAVASINYAGQAGQIAFLDALGRVRGEYWHPGHLSYMAQTDIDGDGRDELLLGGANNAEHAATLVVLDPLQINGLSTARSVFDPGLRLMNMPEANEKAVVVFARGCVGRQAPYTRVTALWVTRGNIVADVVDSYSEGTPAVINYEFDHRLNLVAMTPVPQYSQVHREMEQAHQLDHPYDQKREMDDLRRRLVIRWGTGHAAAGAPETTGSRGAVQRGSN